MNKLYFYLNHPSSIWLKLLYRFGQWLPDKYYLQILYYLQMGKPLHLKRPKTFSEKIQWLKLYNRKSEYTNMVDKYAVKDYVADIIGAQYIIPTLGVWRRPEDIEWDALPEKFVLKVTNGGGSKGVLICKDKSTFNKEVAIATLKSAIKRDIYRLYREWPYKNVKPQVIAEQYMEDSNGALDDYKFSCFNGTVNDVMVCYDRGSGNTKFYFFDKQWNLLPLNIRGKNAPKGFTLPKVSCMDEMFSLAGKLSEKLPYARIDFYAVNGHPYFGEITFFPASGFDRNLLPETEVLYGSMISLPT